MKEHQKLMLNGCFRVATHCCFENFLKIVINRFAGKRKIFFIKIRKSPKKIVPFKDGAKTTPSNKSL